LRQFSILVPQSYTSSDWIEDIELASSHGIDGFALNVGSNTWQPKQVAAAYAAASGSAFKLFISFDMTSLSGSCRSDITFLRELILACASSPNQLKWGGKIVVSTFGGENCTFGERSVGAGWYSAVKDGMPPVSSAFIPEILLCILLQVHFIPSFFDPSLIDDPVLDGFFNVRVLVFSSCCVPYWSAAFIHQLLDIVERWLANGKPRHRFPK
jgi:glucan endo-1,3-alpha-glucosidase